MRGKTVRTTISDTAAPARRDHVNRQFQCAAAERAVGRGFHVCRDLAGLRLRGLRDRRVRPPDRRLAGVAARRSGFVLDALEQALYDRPVHRSGLIHHSDRGVQYVWIRYTERLAEAGVEPSVGSVGDSYDNALAETIIGLYKTEVIRRQGPWRGFDAVELATLEWVDWFNHRRLLEPIGNMPPAEGRRVLSATRAGHGGLTQTKRSPANPGRFRDRNRRRLANEAKEGFTAYRSAFGEAVEVVTEMDRLIAQDLNPAGTAILASRAEVFGVP